MKHQLIVLLFLTKALAQDIDLTGYNLTFEDNFNIQSISKSSYVKAPYTWFATPPYGAAGAYSVSQWGTDSSKCVDGMLEIGAGWSDSVQKWYSGQISSKDTTNAGFSQQYGYFSARLQMPVAGQGAWPSFWLMTDNSIPSNQGDRLEIDILEWYGNAPDIAQQVVHLWNTGGGNNPGYMVRPQIPGGNASSHFHIYGCKVTPQEIVFYIDGIETGRTVTPSAYIGPMYIMIAYALGGGWPLTGEPFVSKGYSAMLVDWVRVYSLPTMPTPTPTPIPTPSPGRIKGYFEGTLDGIFIPTP